MQEHLCNLAEGESPLSFSLSPFLHTLSLYRLTRNDDCETLTICLHSLQREKEERERERERSGRDGERKDNDKEDRQFNEQASDVLEEKEWIVEESEGASDPVRRGGWSHHLLQY
ncbi:hypothetical protein HAX54_000019 [Datura stramonium]|uniref:Uncharacterized protein n=1 Tax=Datura stramonium TaxID=4076 RepID=A0ABS8RHF7_DATST|nr:hypothetical protein [Datura stramonium]